jgi:CubicO group peptidase (beta-lactamase class C family)
MDDTFPRMATLARASAALLLGLLASCRDGSAPEVTSFDRPAANAEELVRRLDQIRRDLSIPGLGVSISRDQQIVVTQGLGLADVENNVAPTGTTSFHLASLTKTYASTLLMQLVEEGKVDLEDPVSKYGVTLASPGTVRVRHLLTHTSEGVPGSSFSYNGDRYQLLENVIRQASGRSYGELLVERILRPLHLSQTAPNVQDTVNFSLMGLDREAFLRNLAKPYALNAAGQIVPSAYPSLFGAAAGLISSASEVAEYSMAIDRDAFLRPDTKELVFTPARSNSGQAIPYGLGWFVQSVGGQRIVWHYGLWTANSSLIVKALDKRITLVVLANSDRLSQPFPLARGDLMVSPVAREFVLAFVTGNGQLP